jgi:hypothetical protein
MSTFAELAQDLQKRFRSLNRTKILLTAVNAGLSEAEARIFDESKGTNGQSLPSTPYSTRPLSVPVDSLPRRAGEISESGKTAFFIGGYAQLKQQVGRKPLELTGELRRDFSSPIIEANNSTITVSVKSASSADKIESLEFRYGRIFTLNEQEIDIVQRVYVDEISKKLFNL